MKNDTKPSTVEVTQGPHFEACPNPWCESHDYGAAGAPTTDDIMTLTGSDCCRVGCAYCNIEGPVGKDEADAIAEWNTRHRLNATTSSAPIVPETADKTPRRNARPFPATPSRQDGLREALDFIDKFFEPWGAWKTVWWEGEVSDDAAFSDGNALKHVANILRRAALSDTPPPDNERVTRSFQVHRELMDAPRTAWPDWLHNRVAVLGYGDQGFRVCAQPGGADIGNGDWGAFIVERHDGTLAVLSAFNNGGK